MGSDVRLPLDPVADLRRRLVRKPKGSVPAVVRRWWSDHGLAGHPAAVGKRIASALIEQRTVAAKLAGIHVLESQLADHLRAADLPGFARLIAKGHLAEVQLVDRFAVRVLGTLLHRVRGRAEVARVLAGWRAADTVWQRRAACVAFTALAPQGDTALPGLVQLVFGMCGVIVWSPERLDQGAVGWVLRELSRAEPTRVETFFRRHARFMSRECARHAIDRMPAARQKELMAHWKRATSLPRR